MAAIPRSAKILKVLDVAEAAKIVMARLPVSCGAPADQSSGRRRLLGAGLTLLALASPVPASAWFWQTPGFEQINANLAADYPDLPAIDVGDLQGWLARAQQMPPLLIDTRSREEFEISHLPGARHAEDVAAVQALLAEEPADRAIVLYCSVGVRSAALGQRLLDAGTANVYNLQGSIFEWANRDLPLRRGAARVDSVHPFNARWGRLLERDRWSHEP